MPYCPNCNAETNASSRSCWNCDASFEGEGSWKPQAKPQASFRSFEKVRRRSLLPDRAPGLITQVSLGKSPLARKFGSIFLGATAIFCVVVLARSVGGIDLLFSEALIASCFLLAVAFDVRSFTRGQTTWIHYQLKTTGVADQTAVRVLGLGINAAVWLVGVWSLKSW